MLREIFDVAYMDLLILDAFRDSLCLVLAGYLGWTFRDVAEYAAYMVRRELQTSAK